MLWLSITTSLAARMFAALIIFSLLCRVSEVRKILLTAGQKLSSTIYVIAFFSLLAIIDASFGFFQSTLAINNIIVFILTGALFLGPRGGICIGFYCALFYAVLLNSFGGFLSALLFILEGYIAGRFSPWLLKQNKLYIHAAMFGYTTATLHLAIISLTTPNILPAPYVIEDALFPMLIMTTVGTGCFFGLLEDFYQQQKVMEGISAKTALQIANSAISILQNGLNKDSATETAEIIIREAETFDFVSITSLTTVLGFTSFHTEEPFLNFLHNDFKKLFLSNFSLPASSKTFDVIKSYIAIPLYNDKRLEGHLCAGHILNPDITPLENTLVHGIGTVISTQLYTHTMKEKSQLLAEAEVKALQSQINPHFLFNALNTISYYCTQQPLMAKTLIGYLANYFRKNIANTNTFISIREELEHVSAYIHLEQARFGEKIKVNYDIHTDNSFNLPPLILQPLVENAIKHGLYPCINGGTLTIHITQKKSDYRISIIDNGMGMSREQLAKLLTFTPQKKSIGLDNVNKRLVSLYGTQYGLKVLSKENKGTIAIVRIPIKEDNKNA